MDVISVIILIAYFVVVWALFFAGEWGHALGVTLLGAIGAAFIAFELGDSKTAKAEPVITFCGAIVSAEHYKSLLPTSSYNLLITENCPTVRVLSYQSKLNIRAGEEVRLETEQHGGTISGWISRACQDDNCAAVLN